MIYRDIKRYDTKNFVIADKSNGVYQHKTICAYCGKEIKEVAEYEDHEKYSYYNCSCPDALKENEVKNKIESLETQIKNLRGEINKTKELYPKVKYRLIDGKIWVEKIN